MTVEHLDILPLIGMLAHEKEILTGLFIYPSTGLPLKSTPNDQGDWQSHDFNAFESLPFTARLDLAVCDLRELNPLELKLPLSHSVTRLRDLFARRVLIITHAEQETDSALLRALGFSQLELPQDVLAQFQLYAGEAGVVFWQFNILAYKQVPDWLNSKYWANPENWGKYRW